MAFSSLLNTDDPPSRSSSMSSSSSSPFIWRVMLSFLKFFGVSSFSRSWFSSFIVWAKTSFWSGFLVSFICFCNSSRAAIRLFFRMSVESSVSRFSSFLSRPSIVLFRIFWVVGSVAVSIRFCNCSRAATISCLWPSGDFPFFSFKASGSTSCTAMM